MTARAFTNVHKHFSLSPCVSSLRLLRIWQHDVPPLSNFKELQNELQLQILRSCKFCEELRFGACQILIKELRLWQLRLQLSNFYAATNSPASCDLSNFNRAAAAKESCESCDAAMFLFVFLRLKI